MYTNIFSKFRSCWGGGSGIPVVKATGIRQQVEEHDHSITGTIQIRPTKVRIKSRRTKSDALLRKPKLRAINEDRPMMDVTIKINGHQWSSGIKGNDDNNKKKFKQKPPSRDKDYGKLDTVTVPTIAPMSFMF